jgi:hypothetical protein
MRILVNWDEVKLMYEALDSRKIQLKSLSGDDKQKKLLV